jgi:hypothetical protein
VEKPVDLWLLSKMFRSGSRQGFWIHRNPTKRLMHSANLMLGQSFKHRIGEAPHAYKVSNKGLVQWLLRNKRLELPPSFMACVRHLNTPFAKIVSRSFIDPFLTVLQLPLSASKGVL